MNPESLPHLRVVLYLFFHTDNVDPKELAGVELEQRGFRFDDKERIKSVIAAIDDALAHPDFLVSVLLPDLPVTEELARRYLVEVRARFLTLVS